MSAKKIKYYLYVKVEDREYFLTDDQDDAPNWQYISKLGEKLPMFFKTLKGANETLRALVNLDLVAIAEVRAWGE